MFAHFFNFLCRSRLFSRFWVIKYRLLWPFTPKRRYICPRDEYDCTLGEDFPFRKLNARPIRPEVIVYKENRSGSPGFRMLGAP